MANIELVGLSGRIGTGKDFIYNQYLAPLGYQRFALADHFKIWIVGRKLASYDDVFHLKPPEVRHILQQAGTEEGRNVYGNDIWCETAWAWITHFSETLKINKWCITDLRFPNEVEFFQSHNGKIFRIVAPSRTTNAPATLEARSHISETALDNYPLEKYDGLIFNDPEYEPTVGMQVRTLLRESPIIFGTTAGGIPDDEDEKKEDEKKLFEAVGEKLDDMSRLLEQFGRLFI